MAPTADGYFAGILKAIILVVVDEAVIAENP